MVTVIPRTHILRKIKVKDAETGAWRSIAGCSWEAETIAGATVTPAVPTVTQLDTYSALLRIDTVGLNGRSCTTRVLFTDPLAADVLGLDIDFTVKK